MPQTGQKPASGGRTTAWPHLVDTLLVLAVFFAAGGDPPPSRNEAHYLCRLKHFWDPGYCRGDLFLESPDAHFTIVWLFGWVTQGLSLEATAWLGRGLSWALLAWQWARLARRVAPGPLAAPLSAALFVLGVDHLHFGGEWVVGGFEAKSLAYGLVVAALVDAIDGAWWRAWVWIGLATAAHALVGGWSGLALAVAWLGAGPRRTPLASMAPWMLAGAVIGMAGVAPALVLNRGVDPAVAAEAQRIYVFDRLPHHLSPLSKPWWWIAERAARHAAALGLLVALVAMSLRRGAERVSHGESLRLLVRFALAAAGIAACGIVLELALWSDPARAASLLRYYWFRLTDVAAPIAASLVGCAWIGAALARGERRAAAALATAVAIGFGGLAWRTLERAARPTPLAEETLLDPAAWARVCDWARENTPADSLWVVPRGSHTFKWRAQRAEVVTYKDVPQDAAGLVEWRRRIDDVFRVGTDPWGAPIYSESVAALGAQRLERLAEEYGAQYALSQDSLDAAGVAAGRRASLPVLHRDGPYTVYSLPFPVEKR